MCVHAVKDLKNAGSKKLRIKRNTNPQLQEISVLFSQELRTSRYKIIKNRESMNNTINQYGFIYRTINLMTAEYPSFPSANDISKADYFMLHKTSH